MPPPDAGAWVDAPPPKGDGAEEPPKTELTLVAVPGAAEPPPNTDEPVPNTFWLPPPIGFAVVVVAFGAPPNTGGLLVAAAPKTDVLPPVATAPNDGVAVADTFPAADAPKVTGLLVPLLVPNRFVDVLVVGFDCAVAAAPPKLKAALLLG